MNFPENLCERIAGPDPGWRRVILSAAILAISAAPAIAKKATLPAAPDYYLSFSQDGHRILCQRKGQVWVFQLDPHRQILHLSGIPSESTLDAKGRRLAVREPEGSLALYDCDTGKKLWKLSSSGKPGTRIMSPGLAFNPTGSQLLYLSPEKGVLLDTNNGRTLQSWSWSESTGYQNAFSPDGKVLFHGTGGSVQAVSTKTGTSVATFPMPSEPILVSYAENCARVMCSGGELRISYPGLQRLAPESPAPQVRADGQMRWRRTPAGLEVLNRDNVVFRGPLDDRVSWWSLCGGFPISSVRTQKPIGLFAENGVNAQLSCP